MIDIQRYFFHYFIIPKILLTYVKHKHKLVGTINKDTKMKKLVLKHGLLASVALFAVAVAVPVVAVNAESVKAQESQIASEERKIVPKSVKTPPGRVKISLRQKLPRRKTKPRPNWKTPNLTLARNARKPSTTSWQDLQTGVRSSWMYSPRSLSAPKTFM